MTAERDAIISAALELAAQWHDKQAAFYVRPITAHEAVVAVAVHERSAQAIRALAPQVAGMIEDAERGRWMLDHAEWRRYSSDERDPGYTMFCIRLPEDADLSCYATRQDAIDAARGK